MSTVALEPADRSRFHEVFLVLCGYLLALKALSVGFYSSRGVTKGWPFDSFVFETFHRFTDYLIPYYTAGYNNMYDPAEWESKGLALAPYGHFQYALLRYLPWRESRIVTYGNFLIVLLVVVLVTWLLIRRVIGLTRIKAHIFLATLLVTFFPLHYIVDRGNLDIYGLIAILLSYFVLWNYTGVRADRYFALLTTILICLKPSFGLFLLPLLLAGTSWQIAFSIAVVAFNYLIPSLFYGAPVNYIVDYINEAAPYTKGSYLFCHSIPCSLDAIGTGYPERLPFVLLGVFLVALIWIRWRIRHVTRQSKFKVLFTTTIFGTLLINPQSWDYRLTFLLPIILVVAPEFASKSKARCFLYAGLAAGSTGYVNILIPGVFAYDGLVRCLCICVLGTLVIHDWLVVLGSSTTTDMREMATTTVTSE